jgi:S1-C subfamily serine protease
MKPSLPQVAPLSPDEELVLTLLLIKYFTPSPDTQGKIQPKPLANSGVFGLNGRHPLAISALVRRLVSAGFLIPAGSAGSGGFPFNDCYYSMPVLTKHQKRGQAWLTEALGWDHLLRFSGPQVCQIVGEKEQGDVGSGSGFVLPSGTVITNAHVIQDMVPKYVVMANQQFEIKSHQAHPRCDVGLVWLNYGPGGCPVNDAGISFREHRNVESVLLVGYPPVPFSKSAVMTAQTGETCGAAFEDYNGDRQLLFSAISRPGNSGGPIFGKDGRVVGIVARSLEMKGEAAPASLPFFSAVPAASVRQAVCEMSATEDFPWETWDQ